MPEPGNSNSQPRQFPGQPGTSGQSWSPENISLKELNRIATRTWKNEADGKTEGLTAWNKGEKFASLGIGHFIWFPQGASEPFEESFPDLMRLLVERGHRVPRWLRGPCPWNSRDAFERAQPSPEMGELRQLLIETFDDQARFMVLRLEKMMKDLPGFSTEEVRRIHEQYSSLSGSEAGRFALVNYVNFKGEGISLRERYQGQGWGLAQVLLAMPAPSRNPTGDMAAAAAAILERRVRNSPPERNEARWLPGWKNRVRAYAQ